MIGRSSIRLQKDDVFGAGPRHPAWKRLSVSVFQQFDLRLVANLPRPWMQTVIGQQTGRDPSVSLASTTHPPEVVAQRAQGKHPSNQELGRRLPPLFFFFGGGHRLYGHAGGDGDLGRWGPGRARPERTSPPAQISVNPTHRKQHTELPKKRKPVARGGRSEAQAVISNEKRRRKCASAHGLTT